MDSDSLEKIKEQPGDFTVRLRNETLQLLDMFSHEYNAENLASMLHAAWITLETPNSNPDFVPQAAHSIREFIEKAHDQIVEIPVKIEGNGLKGAIILLNDKWYSATQNTKSINITDWSGTIDSPFQKMLKSLGNFFATFSAEHRPRGAQHKAVLATLDGSGQPIPEAIAKERLKLWSELDDLFKDVAHHGKTLTKEELKAKIIVLEDFILDIKYPERSAPIDILNELDNLIAEGGMS